MSSPLVDERGRYLLKDGRIQWKRTLADSRLAKYDPVYGFWYQRDGRQCWYPLWRYIESWEWIVTKRGRVVPFEMNEGQVYIYEQMCLQKVGSLPPEKWRPESPGYTPTRINDAKARQVGGSTLFSGMFFPLGAFSPDKRVGIIADTKDHGSELLGKYRLFYERTPAFLKGHLNLTDNNDLEMTFDYGQGHRSTFKVIVQGDKAGNSMTFNYLHESEVAKWDEVLTTTSTLDATVDATDPESIIVRETTSQGQEWKSMFEDSYYRQGSVFKGIFVPWHVDRGYSKPYDGHQLTEYEEKTLVGKLKLSLDQCQFWSDTFRSYGKDKVAMGKYYPSTPQEMFRSDATGIFDGASISARKEELGMGLPLKRGDFSCILRNSVDGRRIDVEDERFVPDPYGHVCIYEEPVKGHPYILNSDPTFGGEDEWAVMVIDNSNMHQCAVLGIKGAYERDILSQALCLYRYYARVADLDMGDFTMQRVMACCEMNTPTSFMEHMAKAGCKCYVDTDQEAVYQYSSGTHYGYKTKPNNRDRMLQLLQELIREDRECFNDPLTLTEMENFVWIPKKSDPTTGKAQAAYGHHDDRVMCYAGALYVSPSWDHLVREEPKKKRGGLRFDPLDDGRKAKQGAFLIWH